MAKLVGAVVIIGAAIFALTYAFEENILEKKNDNREVKMEDVKKEAKEAYKAAGEYMSEQKDEYVKELEKQYGKLGESLASLKLKTQTEVENESKKLLENLRSQKDNLSKKIEELKASGQENWKQLSKDAQSALESLKKDYEQFKEKFQLSEEPSKDARQQDAVKDSFPASDPVSTGR